MTGSGRGAEARQQEISDISRSLKALARELSVPVVADVYKRQVQIHRSWLFSDNIIRGNNAEP